MSVIGAEELAEWKAQVPERHWYFKEVDGKQRNYFRIGDSVWDVTEGGGPTPEEMREALKVK